jgi:hypothetical protein
VEYRAFDAVEIAADERTMSHGWESGAGLYCGGIWVPGCYIIARDTQAGACAFPAPVGRAI